MLTTCLYDSKDLHMSELGQLEYLHHLFRDDAHIFTRTLWKKIITHLTKPSNAIEIHLTHSQIGYKYIDPSHFRRFNRAKILWHKHWISWTLIYWKMQTKSRYTIGTRKRKINISLIQLLDVHGLSKSWYKRKMFMYRTNKLSLDFVVLLPQKMLQVKARTPSSPRIICQERIFTVTANNEKTALSRWMKNYTLPQTKSPSIQSEKHILLVVRITKPPVEWMP